MPVSTFNERHPRSLFIVYLTHGHNKRVGGQQSWVANAIRSEKKIIYKSKLWWSNWELLMWSCRPSFARVISLEHSVVTTLRGGCNEASLAKTCELVYLLHKCTWTGLRHQSITICPFFFIVPPLFRKLEIVIRGRQRRSHTVLCSVSLNFYNFMCPQWSRLRIETRLAVSLFCLM